MLCATRVLAGVLCEHSGYMHQGCLRLNQAKQAVVCCPTHADLYRAPAAMIALTGQNPPPMRR